MNSTSNQIAGCFAQTSDIKTNFLQYFEPVANQKMLCGARTKDISSHFHSSNFRNHTFSKHPKKSADRQPSAKVPEMEAYFASTSSAENNLPKFSPSDRQAIAACCAYNILPYGIVEDPAFPWAYNCKIRPRTRSSDQVIELVRDWRIKIKDDSKGEFNQFLLDGWKNPINVQIHMCFKLGLVLGNPAPFLQFRDSGFLPRRSRDITGIYEKRFSSQTM